MSAIERADDLQAAADHTAATVLPSLEALVAELRAALAAAAAESALATTEREARALTEKVAFAQLNVQLMAAREVRPSPLSMYPISAQLLNICVNICVNICAAHVLLW